MDPEASHLRARAAELRRLAAAIESSSVMSLDRYATEEAVIGQRFDDLLVRLRSCQHDLYSRSEELRWSAYQLELRADELDAAAARAAALSAAGIV